MAKREWAPYEEASSFAKNEGITNVAQWHVRSKQGLPKNIPSNPQQVYEEEFKNGGWGRFLGIQNHPNESKIERSLRYALEQAFGEPMPFSFNPKVRGTSRNWRVDVLLSDYRLVVEYDGGRYHHNREQKDTIKTQDLLAAGYHVVRIRASTSRHPLKALREGWDLVLNGDQTHATQIDLVCDHLINLNAQRFLLLNPETISRVKSWKEKKLPQVNFRTVLKGFDGFAPYEEASAFAQKEGITSQKQWFSRKNYLPNNIPAAPPQVYREEFKNGGWGRFLGTGIVATFNRKYVSYEEASAFAKKEGIASQKQWYIRFKQGLPENMPRNPWRTYKEEFKNGGWGRFLGTGNIAPQKRRFVSYEEAAAFAQKKGIASWSQWIAFSNKGLPKNIPSNPQQVYKEEFKNGGWGRFLGTGNIAPKNRQYVSYEEAAAFAQREGITTSTQWRARANQGLPENIPYNPGRAYKQEFKHGGIKRFLATGPFAKQPAPEPPVVPEMPSISQWRAQRNAAPEASQQPPVAPKRPKP